MPNSRIQEMDNFLRYYANIIRDNPDYEFTGDFFYTQLKNYGLSTQTREDITDLWPSLMDYYKNAGNLVVYNDLRQASFLQFRSRNVPYSSDCYKMYITFDKEHMEQGVKYIFDFIEQNNIMSASKISSYTRSDAICLRIFGEEDAIKVVNYINSNNYLTSYARATNPFVHRQGIVGLAYDDGLSFNATLSSLLSSYYNGKISSNSLNTVSYDDFASYAKHYGEAIYSTIEGMEWLESTPDFISAIRRCNREPNEVHVNYKNVYDLIGKEAQRDFTTNDYMNSCRVYMDPKYKVNLKNDIQKKREEPTVLLDNYLDHCMKKYGDDRIVEQQLKGYIDGNPNTITRDNNFRQLFQEYLKPDRVQKIVSGNLSNYMKNYKTKKYSTAKAAIEATYAKYGAHQVSEAIKRGLTGDFACITNGQAGYRNILKASFTGEEFRSALAWIVENSTYLTTTDELTSIINDCLSSQSRHQ